jgi:hypothetical protein
MNPRSKDYHGTMETNIYEPTLWFFLQHKTLIQVSTYGVPLHGAIGATAGRAIAASPPAGMAPLAPRLQLRAFRSVPHAKKSPIKRHFYIEE